ncbi:MAG: bifunctional phosphopantothenoylcysteine decarboxylase/phosphopantothenate--cysteine ligase CoaBC [Polyangiaceae bacterium]
MSERFPSEPPALRIIRSAPPSRPPGPKEAHKGPLLGKQVLLIVTGSVAAYKAPLLVRLFKKAGAEVDVILTRSAQNFVGAATFSGLTGRPCHTDMWDAQAAGEKHVELAREADLIVVAPATADFISRMAQGRADDLAAATALCATCPVLLAPAMHPNMWGHPATQRNVTVLESDGRVERLGPTHGEVASGETGVGRMVEPEEIASRAVSRLSPRDLVGRHVVVTAGPTLEDLDPVRFIGNRSSGKMGYAIAERAAARGARTTLISGPTSLKTPQGVHRVDVRSAIAMRSAVWQALGPDLAMADALIMAAAVGDYRPTEMRATKIKREADTVQLDLAKNPDILAEVGKARSARRPTLVGFAVETDSDDKVAEYARKKLEQKRCDVVVANHADDAFGKDDNRITLVTAKDVEPLPRLSKYQLADHILDWVAKRVGASA